MIEMVRDVRGWAHGAEIGDRVVYHTRPLDMDRHDLGYRTVQSSLSAAMMAHGEGLVFLAQRKDRQRRIMLYEATRISTPTARFLGLVGQGR